MKNLSNQALGAASPQRNWRNAASSGARSEVAVNVRFGSKADICSAQQRVRFTPESGHVQCNSACPLCAKSGHPFALSRTGFADRFAKFWQD